MPKRKKSYRHYKNTRSRLREFPDWVYWKLPIKIKSRKVMKHGNVTGEITKYEVIYPPNSLGASSK